MFSNVLSQDKTILGNTVNMNANNIKDQAPK